MDPESEPENVCALQGKPTYWVSSHRYHHLQTDTPLDPHSPAEGFWWAHMGWVMDKLVSFSDYVLVDVNCGQPPK
jgi:fatty-acid desaturase